MPHETLKTIKPRKYQEEIYKTCIDKNCLVVLPTGIGKTLIALMLAVNRQKAFPATKSLFLAPTRPLAEQHLQYFKKYLPELFAELTLFTGKVSASKRKQLWQTSDIIFSTPQCIGNDLKNSLYTLEDVNLLIEDECHRCLKNYAYTYVAEKYKEQAKNPRVLGLTASPGADRKTIKQIAKNLGIETIELRTRDSDDVKEYLQELKFEIIRLDFPDEFKEIQKLIKQLCDKKTQELKNRKLLYAPSTKKNIIELQRRIMGQIAHGGRNFNVLAGASACAQVIKLQYLLELLETQTISSLQRYFQDLFDQANQNKSKAVKQLIKQPNFNQAYIKTTELLAKNIENPKLLKLRELIKEEFKELAETKEKTKEDKPKKVKRIIVFSQYRETVTKICKELNSLPEINARVFVGQLKKGETGLSQEEQKEIIQDFTLGKINILVSTSIGEEGLDIPEVSAVIFYEPIPSAIRQIQRRGRTARLKPGKLIILMVTKTRDEAYYWSAFNKEKKMYQAISSIQKDLDKNEKPKNKENQKTLFKSNHSKSAQINL